MPENEASVTRSSEPDTETLEAVKTVSVYVTEALKIQLEALMNVESRASSWLGVLGVYAGLSIPALTALGYFAFKGGSSYLLLVALGVYCIFFVSFLLALCLTLRQLRARAFLPPVICENAKRILKLHRIDHDRLTRELAQNYIAAYESNKPLIEERGKLADFNFYTHIVVFVLFVAFVTVFVFWLISAFEKL